MTDDIVERLRANADALSGDRPAFSLSEAADEIERLRNTPIPMRLICPGCGELHVDDGEFATKPHHTHACQHCGAVWRPAIVHTVGVKFLPGFKNESQP